MPREFNRTDRVGSQLQRELATLVRDQLKDPRLGMVTIHEVRVARDFSYAKVFYTAIGGELGVVETTQVLNRAAGFLRHQVGQQVTLRTLPQLHFVHDESIERGIRLSRLIEAAQPRDPTDSD
jgi:ribosome-binding factor A